MASNTASLDDHKARRYNALRQTPRIATITGGSGLSVTRKRNESSVANSVGHCKAWPIRLLRNKRTTWPRSVSPAPDAVPRAARPLLRNRGRLGREQVPPSLGAVPREARPLSGNWTKSMPRRRCPTWAQYRATDWKHFPASAPASTVSVSTISGGSAFTELNPTPWM